MKNRGSTLILINLEGVHPRNIHTKFEANPCSGSREEVEKQKVHAAADNDNGHRVITLTRWVWLKIMMSWSPGKVKFQSEQAYIFIECPTGK